VPVEENDIKALTSKEIPRLAQAPGPNPIGLWHPGNNLLVEPPLVFDMKDLTQTHSDLQKF
jgi:hypothetical protein